MKFDEFRIGDHLWFRRRFDAGDFEAFAGLSGDRNRLHHDATYSASAGYGGPIVPLHLAAAPLSAIAGMGLPGEPSLYLGHDIRAVSPVMYGDEIVYSARIVAISPANRVLTLSVIALRGIEVVIEATMRVQARSATWADRPGLAIVPADRRRRALVTGAGGAIGGAVAAALQSAGWDLLLPIRSARMAALSARFGATAEVVATDLSDPKALADFAGRVGAQDVDLVVHAASPPVHAPLADHVGVTYSAFDAIVRAALPGMLRAQAGAAILVGSTSVSHPVAGWESYVAAKTMGQSVINRLALHARHGVTAATVAPAFVETTFSAGLRPADVATLLPEEVADAIVAAARDGTQGYVALEPGRTRRGSFAPSFGVPAAAPLAAAAPAAPLPAAVPVSPDTSAIDTIVRRTLELPPDFVLNSLAIGDVPSWDSLRHIQLVLELEQGLSIHFRSDEIERTRTYASLRSLCLSKLAPKQPGAHE
jgi:short-subunit dehydrogenase/acyl dehydratase/acyl carrier protein